MPFVLFEMVILDNPVVLVVLYCIVGSGTAAGELILMGTFADGLIFRLLAFTKAPVDATELLAPIVMLPELLVAPTLPF